MKLLGIDYGTKHIGLATSNNTGTICWPFLVIQNDAKTIQSIKKTIQEERIEKVVVGLPEYNKETPFYKNIKTFIKNLEREISLPIETYDELLTSEQAKRTRPQPKDRHDMAAQLILEGYVLQKG